MSCFKLVSTRRSTVQSLPPSVRLPWLNNYWNKRQRKDATDFFPFNPRTSTIDLFSIGKFWFGRWRGRVANPSPHHLEVKGSSPTPATNGIENGVFVTIRTHVCQIAYPLSYGLLGHRFL